MMKALETYDSVGTVQIKNCPTEIIANDIWNAAIEAAALECEQWDKGASPKGEVALEIRKLKK